MYVCELLLKIMLVQLNLNNMVTHGHGRSDLNYEMSVLQGANFHCGIQFGTEQEGYRNGEMTIRQGFTVRNSNIILCV